jgi:hypothetical protein
MRCPAELYRNSARRFNAAEVELSYPGEGEPASGQGEGADDDIEQFF